MITRFEEWNDVLARDRGTEGIFCPTKPGTPDSDALMTNPPLSVENAGIGLDGNAASPVVV